VIEGLFGNILTAADLVPEPPREVAEDPEDVLLQGEPFSVRHTLATSESLCCGSVPCITFCSTLEEVPAA
jgi:hypothetical protein